MMTTAARAERRAESRSASRARSISRMPEGKPMPGESEEISKEAKSEYSQKFAGGLLSFLVEGDQMRLIYLTIVALLVRLAFLDHPAVVIFDEVHFGGFARKYLRREFFNDLHPPLARLLVTLSAWLGGFKADFSFYDIGADYLKAGVPYITMRAFTAVSGALVVPIAYVTMRGMGLQRCTSLAVAAALIFENALVTQSRLILLDSYLVLFTALTGLFWVLFDRQRHRPFTWQWNTALFGLGASLALAASCKWVGLFAVVAVGLYTLVDLWAIFGDVKVPLKTVGRHFSMRAVALILVPFMIYASTFWIHFALLTESSDSAASFSLEFQQSLHGDEVPPTMKQVYLGSQVRLRQYRPTGPFLHSHAHLYPAGSKQQQVTGYHHRDRNNLWLIRRPFVVNKTYVEEEGPSEESELLPLRHLDEIRLEHLATGRFLHSHQVDPPVSNKEKQHEVSCYGHHLSNFSDLNDNWRIEIVDSQGRSITEEDEETMEEKQQHQSRPPIFAVGTKFRLTHRNVGCKLHCRNKALPEWGFKQSEITCGRETLRSNQIWIIESNEHPAADAQTVEKVSIPKKGFWGKFFELNREMWSSNAGLSSYHPFGSRPGAWPLLSRGIGFWNGHHVPKTEKQHLEQKKRQKSQEGEEGGEGQDAAVAAAAAQPEDEEDKQEQARLAQEYTKYRGQQIYLLGNVALWWAATAAVASYVGVIFVTRLAKRRNLAIGSKIEGSFFGSQLKFFSFSGFMFIQWLWHYMPFFGMQRQLFLHHYLPALYFSILLLAILLDAALTGLAGLPRIAGSERKVRMLRMIVLGALVMSSIYVFWRLAPLGYGLRMSKTQCESLKWFKRWDFDCGSLADPVANAAVTS